MFTLFCLDGTDDNGVIIKYIKVMKGSFAMKSRILMCFIVFVIAITNISCHNEPEGSTTGSIKSVTDDPKGES